MRREGSPWRGVGAVFLKELSDHLTGARMLVLEWLVVLTAVASVYVSIQEIKKAIEDLFAGAYAPSPGAVYPTLSLLEDQGQLASAADEGGKRVFSLTEAGRVWLDENRAAVDGVMARMRLAARMASGQLAPEVVRESMHTVRQAILTKPGDWSEAETARVVEILMAAVREIGKA